MKNQRIRFTVVSNTLSRGGAERFCSTLLSQIDRQRFQCSIVLLKNEIEFPIPEQVEVASVDHRWPWNLLRSIRRLRRAFVEFRPHVVLSSIDYVSQFVGEAVEGLDSPPAWIARVAENPERDLGGLKRWVCIRWLNRVFPRAACVVANSQGVAETYQRMFKSTRHRLEVIPNPVAIASIQRRAKESRQPARSRPRIVVVGRLSREKRPDVALEVANILHGRGEEFVMTFCGDGPLRGALIESINRKALQGCVELAGYSPDPYPLMNASDVFLMTSDYEGLPNALLEAQVLGLPAVSTNCPHGPNEIIVDGITGYLVSCGDAVEIADRTAELLRSPGLRSSMGESAAFHARRVFDASVVVPEWESILANVANGV
ncbi:MAG: glycosyltransferase [Pirellulaceae bacterium]|nr:glycosyltransferase [Pirellulaceae bacterium]